MSIYKLSDNHVWKMDWEYLGKITCKNSSYDIFLRLMVANTFKFDHTYWGQSNPKYSSRPNEYKMFSNCKSLWKCYKLDSYNLKHSHCSLHEYLVQIGI